MWDIVCFSQQGHKSVLLGSISSYRYHSDPVWNANSLIGSCMCSVKLLLQVILQVVSAIAKFNKCHKIEHLIISLYALTDEHELTTGSVVPRPP